MASRGANLARKLYTGIGSRTTPGAILDLMKAAGAAFSRAGWTLRSGGANGADAAFEVGARSEAPNLCEIYLPWPGFNANESKLFSPTADAMIIAASLHPAWENLSSVVRILVARNVHQILGMDVHSPTLPSFLICWTPDGASSDLEYSYLTGGTGTAIALASRHGVPVHNLQRDSEVTWLERTIATLDIQSAEIDLRRNINS